MLLNTILGQAQDNGGTKIRWIDWLIEVPLSQTFQDVLMEESDPALTYQIESTTSTKPLKSSSEK
jgi:hypothetical protein